jgi:NADH dehydrogenase
VIPHHRSFRAIPTHADAIVNCVGIIREDRENFAHAHVEVTKFLLKLARKLKVQQYVHVSALGIEPGTTAYQRSKLQAERLVLKSRVPYAIIRPSMMFGEKDKSINRIRAISRTGFFPLLANGTVQPVHVDTVAALIVAAVERRIRDRTVEVGGPEVFTYRQIAGRVHPGVVILEMPGFIVTLVTKLSALFLSLPTKEMVEMMAQENRTADKTVWKLGIANPKLQ